MQPEKRTPTWGERIAAGLYLLGESIPPDLLPEEVECEAKFAYLEFINLPREWGRESAASVVSCE